MIAIYIDICCILCLFLVAAAIALLTTLTYMGVEPRFHVQHFHILALNDSTNLSTSSISMDLKFIRVVAFAPLCYEDLNVTLYYSTNRSFSLGSCLVAGFYQGRKKTAHRRAVVQPHGRLWEDALGKISGGSVVELVVEVTTKYRLRQCDGDGDCSYTKAKAVVAAADASGEEVSKKPIRLH